MHFVVNDEDYFDLEIEEPTTIQTADKFFDYENAVKVSFDFNLKGYGWGCGGGWYVSRKDIINMLMDLRHYVILNRNVLSILASK